jgi:hypothetical protein
MQAVPIFLAGALSRLSFWAWLGTLVGACEPRSPYYIRPPLTRFFKTSALPSTPAPEMTAAQRAQAAYEDARIACFFQLRQEETKQRAEVGNDVAADDALEVCLGKAEAERMDASPSTWGWDGEKADGSQGQTAPAPYTSEGAIRALASPRSERDVVPSD